MAQPASVFVSHCHEDNVWCRAFVAALGRAGADIWYDEKSLGYGLLMEEIERELRARPIFIPVLSPAAVASKWVRREVSAAIRLHDEQPERIVLPVIAERCEVPLLWGEYKWVSGPEDAGLSPDDAAERVIQTLGLAQAAAPKRPWDETRLFASLVRACTPEGLQAARQLFDFARQRGAAFAWGTGPLPSVSARFFAGAKPLTVFTLYEWPAGNASFAINFEYLVDSVPSQMLGHLAEQLRKIPGIADRYAGLEQANFKKRPALSVDHILTQPGVVETIEEALDNFARTDRWSKA